MARKQNRPRGVSRPIDKDPESAAHPPMPSDLSIDYDERSQCSPLEGPTGRMLALLPTGDTRPLSTAVTALSKAFSLRSICSTRDFAGAMDVAQMDSAEVIVFHEFGIAVIKSDPDRRTSMIESARGQGMIVEPEYWNHPLGMLSQSVRTTNVDGEMNSDSPTGSLDYYRGLRDGLSRMIDILEDRTESRRGMASTADFRDSATATWGLQATGVTGTTLSGTGVRVAVLDTGFDVTHPDFVGRNITSETFIPLTTATRSGNVITLTDISATTDQSGHGTHCIGVACGPRVPQNGPRYGIAHGAEIFNGKVLSVIPGTTQASGADAWILNGIHWAIKNECSIISMSLGSSVRFGDSISTAFESVARSAWESGVLMVAAAGNDSDREGRYPPFFRPSIAPVARPANCPHIVAVAAVEPTMTAAGIMKVANFSNRHMIDEGGEINMCGPGVSILSSYTRPRYQFLDGTSQATPHVAGIAALVQEQTGKKGKDLYYELRGRVVAQGSRVDYGNGLIHV